MCGASKAVRVGVGAFIISEGRVLLLKRDGSHGAGTWALVGGHQEFGESPEETAVREVAEEVGLDVKAVERLGFSDDQMPDDDKHYITLFIRCEWLSGEPRIVEPDRAKDLAWFSFDELHERQSELFVPLRNFLDQNPDLKSRFSI